MGMLETQVASSLATCLRKDFNFAAFSAAEKQLRELEFVPVNPHHNGVASGSTWSEHMRADIKMLMDCNRIYMLRGWEKSRGALIEYQLAVELGMVIMHEPPVDGEGA